MPARARFLALGDSYTIGEGVARDATWPAQLGTRLAEAGVPVASPDLVAKTGWSTDELADAIDACKLVAPYALVTLLVGVNNQYRGRDPDNYRDEFAGLLERAIAFAGAEPGRVIVISIPDWGVTPFAGAQGVDAALTAAAIDAFNAIGHAVAGSRGTRWVDVTGLSRGIARDLLAPDGLHPSAGQYAYWVEAIMPEALAALRSGASRPG